MTQPIPRDAIYRRRVFDAEVIELCVRWYITYRLSYRDLVEIMAERGVLVATLQSCAGPSIRAGVREALGPVRQACWRLLASRRNLRFDPRPLDYLYRAVDKHGKTVDFLLRSDRGIAAALAFFRKALGTVAPRVPRKITLDGHRPSRRALWLLRHEHPCWRNVQVRTSRYLNNVVEQDHRAIKRRCASMTGFKSFATAAVTLAGIELAHRIRKRQFRMKQRHRQFGKRTLKEQWALAVA